MAECYASGNCAVARLRRRRASVEAKTTLWLQKINAKGSETCVRSREGRWRGLGVGHFLVSPEYGEYGGGLRSSGEKFHEPGGTMCLGRRGETRRRSGTTYRIKHGKE